MGKGNGGRPPKMPGINKNKPPAATVKTSCCRSQVSNALILTLIAMLNPKHWKQIREDVRNVRY